MQTVFRELFGIIDRSIGELRNARPEADLLVFSFSGMGPNYSGWHILPEVLARIGMGAPEENKRLGGYFSPLQRWGPWKTRALERILSPRMIEAAKARVPARFWDRWTRRLLHANSGWDRSIAFCVPNDYTGAIRINLQGREPRGRIAAGEEYQRVCDQITTALLELRHIETGRPVVKEVVHTHRIYSGPHLEALPDLMVLWANESLVTGVSSPRVGEIRQAFPERRTGAHRPTGFFAAAGPQTRSDPPLESIHLLDLAPTILGRFGIEPPQHFDGRMIEAWIAPQHPG
jgi:predicted AlkP superfamily phosphohydrolase/phosphomutase